MPIQDRRQYPRYPAAGLMAKIAGRLVEVEDISLGGVRFGGGLEISPEEPVSFTLYPCDGDRLQVDQGISVSGEWVGRYGQSTALKFNRTTLPLAKLILRQASRRLGVEPYLLK